MISNPYDSGCVCFQNCSEWEDYTIQEKDTLYNISVRFGVPIRMLMACNRLINPYNLQVGQIIKIPASRTEFPGCTGENEESYIIQLRDTLFSIAEKQNTSVEKIIEMNPWVDPYNLKPGSRICVPKKQAASPHPSLREEPADMVQDAPEAAPSGDYLKPGGDAAVSEETGRAEIMAESTAPEQSPDVTVPNCGGRYYIVKSGDTLESILDSFDYTYAALAFANPDVDLFNLTQSTKICIPMYDMFKSCNSGTIYVVRSGDSLSSLSERFAVSRSALMAANPFMRAADFSTAGSRVCIPE